MEGPSLVILKNEINFLKGKNIVSASGSSSIPMERLDGRRIKEIRTFGKHFLIAFKGFTIRIHFLMFGSYRLNERKDLSPRLSLLFDNDELNFYSCAVALIEQDPDDIYDWSVDVMSDSWDSRKARKKLKAKPGMNIGDALLDQSIFAGVGNIIKNEVLYRIRVHPESVIGELPPRKLTTLINEARNYSFDFFEWKQAFVLSRHWEIYKKKKCRRCDLPVVLKHTGSTPRRSFFCENCQVLYK